MASKSTYSDATCELLGAYPAFVDPLNHLPLRLSADGAFWEEPSSRAIYLVQSGITDLRHPRMPREEPQVSRFDRPLPAVAEAHLNWTFHAFGGDETELRSHVIDKLDLKPDSVVLDNGCGTGATTRLLQDRLPQGVLCNGDISMDLLRYAADRIAAKSDGATCRMVWCGANALHLPFADNSFDAVVCLGGFNQFGDAPRAVAEMTRVTRSGGRVVIADEGLAPWLRHTLTGKMVLNDNPLMAHEPPLAHLPEVALEVRLEWLLGHAFYCLDYRVGDAPPAIDVDLHHVGLRGGSMRSRYEAAIFTRTAEDVV
ncbi:class I SAM-dependent methyltransferase [Affinirhizobium pseudoryzae]|uniref:class I SAM-dependent methyltransferase n=1 Tax=Allorhizobium pseudoryzae TaxID=379684 RepID=UPI0013EBA751|nr:methyltransferase domain-containing protein [Allorhizobium pseudoryzae]